MQDEECGRKPNFLELPLGAVVAEGIEKERWVWALPPPPAAKRREKETSCHARGNHLHPCLVTATKYVFWTFISMLDLHD